MLDSDPGRGPILAARDEQDQLLAASSWRRAPGPARGDGGERSLGAMGASEGLGAVWVRDSRDRITGWTTGTGTTAVAREKFARKLQTVREKP
jgi:hypothetical protein